MDHLDRSLDSIYFDLLQSQVSESQDMSVWGSQTQLYKPSSQPASTCSTPSTPPYSMSLDLERKMLEPLGPSSCKMMQPGLLVSDNGSRQPVAVPPPLISTTTANSPSVGSKRKTEYLDPCQIAPLKKRKIQVDLLAPDEKEKVLQKREKNKAAAERCRVKRRENVQKTRVEYDENLELNEALQADIQRLQEERQLLQDLLHNHRCTLKSHA